MQAGREIKFRGKSIKGFGNNLVGTWFYGGIITNPDGNEVHIAYFDNDMLSWRNAPVDPETVGQYTGLRDKNGKEIYEGDIVKFRHSSEPEYNLDATVVEWVPQWCRFCIDGNSGLNGNMNLEAIGNIYENQDLLQSI